MTEVTRMWRTVFKNNNSPKRRQRSEKSIPICTTCEYMNRCENLLSNALRCGIIASLAAQARQSVFEKGFFKHALK